MHQSFLSKHFLYKKFSETFFRFAKFLPNKDVVFNVGRTDDW